MQPSISQQDITVFSTDPSGVKEQPGAQDYANGVDVGYTAPAKWWNWLWNKLTSWCTASKTDRTNMHTELLNTLSEAGIAPSATSTEQLSRSVNIIERAECGDYDTKEETEEIEGSTATVRVNQPHVVGFTLFLPDTELL